MSRNKRTGTTKLIIAFRNLANAIIVPVMASKPLRYIYWIRRGRYSNTKFITGSFELNFVFLNFGPCAFCRSVNLHLEISYGDLHKSGLTNKQVKTILGSNQENVSARMPLIVSPVRRRMLFQSYGL
jgi:hypothetical protein